MDAVLSLTPTGLSRGNVQLWSEKTVGRVIESESEQEGPRRYNYKETLALLGRHVFIFIQTVPEKWIFLERWPTHSSKSKK